MFRLASAYLHPIGPMGGRRVLLYASEIEVVPLLRNRLKANLNIKRIIDRISYFIYIQWVALLQRANII